VHFYSSEFISINNNPGGVELGKSRKEGKKKKTVRRLAVLCLGGAAAYALLRKQMQPQVSCSCDLDERVLLEDEDNISGVGLVMENMISKYLDDADKVRILNGINLKIAIEPVEEPESAITMTFSNGRVVIAPGIAAGWDIKLACDYDVLMELPKMGAGLQTIEYLMTPEGKEVARKFLTGKIKIQGVALNAPEMIKLSMFLAVPPGEDA
jgi:hypothetical protein